MSDFWHKAFAWLKQNLILVYLLVVIIVSFFTYFWGYQNPPYPFWDENYHVASAEKYIQGVFFMEPHPPLGKMFIALGEVILQPNKNINKSEFVKTDYIKDFPENYSFAGVRFFPSLFAWLCAPLLFYFLYKLLKNEHLAVMLTSLYAFDNALIVHFRGAMLESTQFFFIILALCWFITKWETAKKSWQDYLILGLLVSSETAVKVNGLILILLPIFWWLKENPLNLTQYRKHWKTLLQKLFIFTISFAVGLFIVYGAVFYIHFAVTKTVIPNDNYQNHTSQTYKKILADGQTASPLNFALQLDEHLKYADNYTKGVPAFDVCKDGENGSYPLTWPFGNKTISYRWNRTGDIVSYLYLVPNPAIWLLGIIGILLSLILVIGRYVFKTPVLDQNYFNLIACFSALYVAYMAAVIPIGRVLYLYHYFIPLLFSLILFALLIRYRLAPYWENKEIRRETYIAVGILMIIVFATYLFFSPFSYYLPLSKEQFLQRDWFDFWKLKAAN